MEDIIRDIDTLSCIADLHKRYARMRRLLDVVLRQLTADAPGMFAGHYPMVAYVCQVHDLPSAPCNGLRVRCLKSRGIPEGVLADHFDQDVVVLKALASLIDGGTADEIRHLATETDADGHPESPAVLRVAVRTPPEGGVVKVVMADDSQPLDVDVSALSYLHDMLTEGAQLNLVGPTIDADGVCHPWLVVLEPDYLVDVTAIASCFSATIDSADLHIVNRLKPRKTTCHIHLGNMAGLMLDDSLSNMRDGREPDATSYVDCAKAFFAQNALSLAAATDIDVSWHQEAQMQKKNIADMLRELQAKDPNFDVMRTMTEPSFVCEALGVQGRMDLLQNDFQLLVEQKSGKKDWRGGHREEHYVQMVIYQLMLSLQFGVDANKASQYLMYSKYAPSQGLLREGASPMNLIHRIFMIRNGIVFNDLRYTSAANLRYDLLRWTPQSFRVKPVSDKLWYPYTFPELSAVFDPIQQADELSQDYFFQMLAFVQRESVMARLGSCRKEGSGFASLWSTPAADRRFMGNLMDGLRIQSMREDSETASEAGERVDFITLSFPEPVADDDLSMPNFRVGDVAILYDYTPEADPDVRLAIECRASIVALDSVSVTLKLRSPQCRTYFSQKEGSLWAIEHDLLDSQSGNLCRQLMTFLCSDADRRELLLGSRRASVAQSPVSLRLDHGEQNDLVRRFRAADELFLLVGPPGTGKTSRGLVAILRETLAVEGQTVLLMAYTNRAVDEICDRLEQNHIDYLRVGSRFACAEAYRGRLLSQCHFAKIDDIRQTVASTRVFVGTTASVASNSHLLAIKHFDVAIVDEASQILEPNIVGLLSAQNGPDSVSGETRNAISKIVLIGDHKQLPAVVTQRGQDSELDSPLLAAVELKDCRESFFQRMLRLYGAQSPIVFTLTRQGRMHAETAAFCNHFFYNDELQTVPLPHQEGPLQLTSSPSASELERSLATRRVLFLDSASTSGVVSADTTPSDVTDGKVNMAEAELVADVVRTVVRLRRANGIDVSADKTIGVVVPYRNQISAIRRVLSARAEAEGDAPEDAALYAGLTIDTVERLQGSERDVIVYGFTVCRKYQLNFLTESQFVDTDGHVIDRKLNVALSRAREQMIVVANRATIQSVPLYRAMMDFFG